MTWFTHMLLAGLLLSGVVFSASAEDFTYTTNNGTITITGYSGTNTTLVIPASTNGLPVTMIGNSAFYDCDELTSITIPDSVALIGDWALSLCDGLTDVTLGAGVTNIGYGAFSHSPALLSITVNETNSTYSSVDGVLFDKNQSLLVRCPGGLTGDYAMPDSVTVIGEWAFGDCSSLTSITMPDRVIEIRESAFASCSGLTNVPLRAGVTNIGDWVFSSCSSLMSITIPDSVIEIGYYAFSRCSSLTSVTIPDSVTGIGHYAFFSCSGLTNALIGAGVTNIGTAAFGYCSCLTGLYFYGNAPSLSFNVFSGADSVTVYRLAEATGWPPVPGLWGDRPTALWDSDADGISDPWEERYFGNSTNANPTAICSNGINTVLQAYIAGLNPTNPASLFLTSVVCPPSSDPILSWNVATGRVYNVYWSTNLLSGFHPLYTNYTGGTITDTVHSAAGKCFYKLDVRLP